MTVSVGNEIVFPDRRHAGELLGERLKEMELEAPVVVALPRGGVPVGYEVARALGAPLDIGLVRKLGAPGRPELGIGALGESGVVVLDRGALRALGVTRAELEDVVARERAELERRRERYRREHPPLDLAGRDVILVDDGMATGVTAAAAARVLRARGAARILAAVPVSPPGTGEALGSYFDAFISLSTPARFGGVGRWYADFAQTSDREVVELLRASRGEVSEAPAPSGAGGGPVPDPEVSIPTRDGVRLQGLLMLPERPRGLVIFVHGSGSSRHSPRNAAVARRLAAVGFATLLFDLLTEREEADRRNVFDIDLLTRRLIDATGWVRETPELSGLPVGYFGASTGAAAALCAAARLGDEIRAVVSRGGRPDLANHALPAVHAPTLLIVGGDDWNVLEFNDEAASLLGGPQELAVVHGAGHLFEEPGALDRVADLAAGWFTRHLAPGETAARAPGVEPVTSSGGVDVTYEK
jgi:putative phosphoribosyl transferase